MQTATIFKFSCYCKTLFWFQNSEKIKDSKTEEELSDKKPFSEFSSSTECKASKYLDSNDESPLNTRDEASLASPVGVQPLSHHSSKGDNINGPSSGTPPSNMLFPNGKLFGLFPRMGNTLDDQLQVNDQISKRGVL